MKKVLRSLLLELMPEDLRVDIELVIRNRSIKGNSLKIERILELFKKYNITDIALLGPGTNRYAIKVRGYVIKIATDNDGKIDNIKEFKMSKRLQPYVCKVHEVSENGTFLVAEYISPFLSPQDMYMYAEPIREILRKLSKVYLIGDVGINSKNYTNWGLRPGSNDPVCLDFAYVYEVNSELFICTHCKTNTMLEPDKDFNTLYCSACKNETSFVEIKTAISRQKHQEEIGDIKKEGYYLLSSNVDMELDTDRSGYLLTTSKKKKKKKESDIMSKKINELYGKNGIINKLDTNDNIKLPDIETDTIIDVEASVFDSADDVIDIPDDQIEVAEVVFSSDICDIVDNQDIVEVDKVEDNDTVPSDFVKYVFPIVSNLSNRIGEHIQNHDLYSKIANSINVTADEFYKDIQNNIFNTFITYLKFHVSKVTNQAGYTRNSYSANPDIVHNEELKDMVHFLYHFKSFNLKSADADSIMPTIRSKYNTYIHIPSDWFDALESRMVNSNKNSYDIMVIHTIINAIKNTWGNPDDTTTDIKSTDETDMKKLYSQIEVKSTVSDTQDEESSTENEKLDWDLFLFEDEVQNNDSDEDYEDEDSDEDYEDEDSDEDYEDDSEDEDDELTNESTKELDEESDDNIVPSVSLSIRRDCNCDVVVVSAKDYDFNINIPFYCELDKVPIRSNSVMANPTNKFFDWLCNFKPDAIFSTENPKLWLKVNEHISDNYAYRIVELDANRSHTVMGLYIMNPKINVNTLDEPMSITDEDIMNKINAMICDEMAYGRSNRREFTLLETMHNEDTFKELYPKLVEIIDHEDSEDDATDNTESDDKTEEMSVAERIAYNVIKQLSNEAESIDE